MWFLLPILLGISSYAVIVLIVFCLVSAGRKADEEEEKILKIISETSRD